MDFCWTARRALRLSAPWAAAALASASAFVAWLFLSSPAPRMPAFEEVKRNSVVSDGLLLDRHGQVIHQIRVSDRGRRLEWVPLGEISPAVQSAIIRAEDRRFREHGGIDWTALAGAVRDFVSSSSLRGASTIPMQLAAKLDRGSQPTRGRRSLAEKIRQMRAARALARGWSGDQMLEAYLNLVTFRGELQGIAAVSAGLLGKKPHGLDMVESMVLASLVRAPNAPAAQVAARAGSLASAMGIGVDAGSIARCAENALAHPYRIQPDVLLAPHVARMLLEPGGGGRRAVGSTLDATLQRLAAEVLRRHLESVRVQNVQDGAVLVVENSTGDVLAYVGNDGDRTSARFVDGVQAPRQAGSTLKPFLYALAFENRLLTPASLLEDCPVDIPVPGGVYRPRNYDNRFHGTVTARAALAASLNVPAVRTLGLVGVEEFVKRLRAFGFTNLHEADYYGPSLALGSADIKLWDLVNAYRTIANFGMQGGLRLSPGEEGGAPRRVLSPEAAFLVADILSDRESRNRTFSLESPLATRYWTAVKTGTSKDMRDNWCVGFSGLYTVGVWAGNFSGSPMWNVTGVTGAAPIWVEIMSWLHRGVPSRPPHPPEGISRERLGAGEGEGGRTEVFLRGTETTSLAPSPVRANFRIAYPAAGTVIALDPDIPRDDQRVFFEAQPESTELRWLLDGNDFGKAGSLQLWLPERGRHRLTLTDTSGRAVDSVEFEVRGFLPAGK